MRISIQTLGIVDRFGIDEGFRMIREAGFEAVDANLDNWLTPAQIKGGEMGNCAFDLPEAALMDHLRPYRDALRRNGLTVTQAHSPYPTRVRDEAMNEYVLKAAEKAIVVCGQIGCPRLVVHPGCLPFAERGDDEWDHNLRMYTRLIPLLREHGVMCCLENMFTRQKAKLMCGPCACAAEANAYIDHLNDLAGERLFGFCLDVGHAQLVSRDNREFILQLGNNLACFHLHDNDGADDQHLFPYMGIMDWDRLCDAIRDSGYRGDLSFETFNGLRRYPPELATDALRLAARQADHFRRRVLAQS